MDKYEHAFRMEGGNPGRPFDEAYDMKTITPVPAWQKTYDEVVEDLRGMGLAL